MKRIQLNAERSAYDRVLQDLANTKEPLVVERDGQVLGAFVPLEMYQEFVKWRTDQSRGRAPKAANRVRG